MFLLTNFWKLVCKYFLLILFFRFFFLMHAQAVLMEEQCMKMLELKGLKL